MFCTQCGAPLDEGAKFCTHCGAKVELTEESEFVEETQKLEHPLDESLRCKNCGAELEEGVMFCTNCGVAVEPEHVEAPKFQEESEPVYDLPVFETIGANQESAQEQQAPKKKSKKGLIIGIIGAVVLIVAAALLAIFVVIPHFEESANTEETSQVETSDSSEEQTDKEKSSAQEWKSVALPNSYETKATTINNKAVARYSFSYPKDWSVASDTVDDYTETIRLEGPDGVSISFIQMPDSTSQAVEMEFEKIADSNFHLSSKSGDLDSSSHFVVAKATWKKNNGDDKLSFLVLLPEEALDQNSVPTFENGAPYFVYQSRVSFYCQLSDDMSEETQNQVIAMLRSLQIKKAPQQGESSSSDTQSEYKLPDSSNRRYSSSELESMSNYDLFIARNEIYARHGRKFRNQDLVNYFSEQPWYKPSIEPDSFTTDMLNGVERDNVNAMIEIEKSRGSEYLK